MIWKVATNRFFLFAICRFSVIASLFLPIVFKLTSAFQMTLAAFAISFTFSFFKKMVSITMHTMLHSFKNNYTYLYILSIPRAESHLAPSSINLQL